MFKYQKETIKEIIKVAENLEKITDKKYRIKIGYIRDFRWIEGWNGGWKEYSGDLYLRLNSTRFGVEDDYDSFYVEEFNIIDEDAYIKIDKNIFLNLNNWIEKVFKEEKKRKEFHEKLNKELKCINKTFEKI